MPDTWRVLVFADRPQIDQHLVSELVVRAHRGELRRVALASGKTFAGFFALLRRTVDERRARFDDVAIHHLDEFEDVPPFSPGSLSAEIRSALFPDDDPRRGRLRPVDATSGSRAAEIHESNLAGSDLVLLGIGRNGHVAFNEPSTPLSTRSHFAALGAETRRGHAAAFGAASVPERALTAGIATILSARELVLVADGAAKAAAVRDALLGPISPPCPASALRLHDRVTVLLDEEAAGALAAAGSPPWEVPAMAIMDRESIAPPGPTLVVAPHPDDASISCGGLLAMLGPDAMRHIVTFSTGARAIPAADADEATRIRERESEEEAEIQTASVSFLRARAYDSGGFDPDDAAALVPIVERCRPSRVLVPAREDPHPTHRLCRLTAEEAVRAYWERTHARIELWTFEGPWFSLDRASINVLAKLDRKAHDQKQAGIRAHRSQVDRVPFDAGAEALERLRALTFSESHLGGRSAGGFDPDARLECYRRVAIGG
jgi:glucosamine-6-phosphate deaminase